MQFRSVFYINGILLLILSAAMLFPALVDLANQVPDWRVFASSQIICAFTGFALIFSNKQKNFTMGIRETFILTSLSWVTMAAFGALPIYLADINLTYTQAFFESMSGITTTGSTVIAGLDNLPGGILLWRSILHWLGGIGFIVIALAVLPLLQISGMQIYKTQSFGDVDKVLPSASQMAVYICLIYIALTIVCGMAFNWAGMGVFDAVNHAMSTIATGGFSTSDLSLGKFKSPLIDWVAILFMGLAGLPFLLYLKAMRGDNKALFHDSQVRAFLGIFLTVTLLLTAYLIYTGRFFPIDALRNAAFTVMTLITTTGFASGDYTLWGPFVIAIAFLLTFLGSCSGSTAGGLKIFRLQILWGMTQQQLSKLMHPSGIFQVRYNAKVVDTSLQAAIAGFFFVYLASWIIFGVMLQMTGLDFTTAFSGSLTALSNVGPGVGEHIGPAGNFANMNTPSLWILSFAMLFGRVELFTLLVVFMPRFWRR